MVFGKTENYHKDACKYYFAEKMCFRFNLTDCGDRKMSNDFGYVNFHYGVNACVDRRVVAYGACEAIRWWIKDGGRDCRLTKGQKNGCYGQVERRDQESTSSAGVGTMSRLTAIIWAVVICLNVCLG